MKRTWTWCLVALLALSSAAWSQAKKGGSGAEEAVAAMEQKWLQSQKTNNSEALASILADKFSNTNGQGQLTDKTATLASAKATKYASVDYTDLKVTAFGGTAVATGIFKAKGTDDKGKPMDVNERFTDTWVKMPNGQWQCVASQGTPLKM